MNQSFWAVLSLVVAIIAAVRVSGRFLPGPVSSIRLAVALILIVLFQLIPVHVVGTLQLAGVFQKFSMLHITLATLALMAATWFLPRRAQRLEELAIDSQDGRRRRALPAIVIVSIALISVTYAAFLADTLTSYPRSWDGVDYRLPLAVRWLQDGSLAIPEGGLWKASLPGNGEVVSMLLLGTGWQALAALMNLPAALIMALSVFHISSRLGASRPASILAALMALSIPMIAFQTFSNYVDLFGTAFLMAAVALCMAGLATSPARRSLFFMSGLACGVAIGAKPTFWVSATLFLILAFGVNFVLPRKSRCSALRCFGVLFIGALIPSVFWIGRALLTTGNPFYPLAPDLFGLNLFEGASASEITPEDYELNFVRSTWEWLIYPWFEFKRSGFNLGTGSGLGALYAAFVPLGVFYAVGSTIITSRGRRIGARPILLFAVFIGLTIWWMLLHRLPRFGVPHIVLGCILSAALLDRMHRQRPRIFGTVWLSALILTCVLTAFIPLSSFAGRVRSGRWERHQICKVPSVLDTLPKGASVANLSDSFHNNFALAGRSLTNRVICHWEIPDEDPASFVARRGADYIADMDPEPGGTLDEQLLGLGYRVLDTTLEEVSCRIWERGDDPPLR
jgi:hypothetical protein